MKISKLLIFAAVLLGSFNLYSQIGIEVSMNRKVYLTYEDIYAKVVVRNYSGKSLIFSENDEKLYGSISFIINTPSRSLADARKKTYNPMIGVVLAPGASQELMIPVSKLYIMCEAGNYTLKALIRHKLLSSSYESNPINFTICNGTPIWERIVGVPDFFKKDNTLDVLPRTVKLLSFNDGTGEILCLMIEDRDKVYSVVRLNYDIGGNPPDCEIDGLSRVHILSQVSPSLYLYFIYDVNGKLENKDVYVKIADSPPAFVMDNKDGSLMITGGKKAVKDVDYSEKDGIPFLINRGGK